MNVLQIFGSLMSYVDRPARKLAAIIDYADHYSRNYASVAIRDGMETLSESPLITDPIGVAKRNPGRTGIVGATGLSLLTFAGFMMHGDVVKVADRTEQAINIDGGSISQDEISAFVSSAAKEGKLEQLQKDIRTISWADRDLAKSLQAEVDVHNTAQANVLMGAINKDGNGTIGFEEAVSHVAEIAKSDSSPGFSTDETGRLEKDIRLLNQTGNSAVSDALQAAKASYLWHSAYEVKTSK